MYVKFPSGNLNPGPCPPLSTITYIYRVNIIPSVCGDNEEILIQEITKTFGVRFIE